MYLIFLLIPVLLGCSHQSRIERLEREVRSLKKDLSEMEADWALFQSTPDGRWVYPKKDKDEDDGERKKTKRVKK